MKSKGSRKQVQTYLKNKDFLSDAWWYTRKIYSEDGKQVTLVLPGESLVKFNRTTGKPLDEESALPALKELDEKVRKGSIRPEASFNEPAFLLSLQGGEYLKKIEIQRAKKNRCFIRAVYIKGHLAEAEEPCIRTPISSGLQWWDTIEDVIRKRNWGNVLSQEKIKELRPVIEKTYNKYVEFVRLNYKNSLPMLSDSDINYIRRFTSGSSFYWYNGSGNLIHPNISKNGIIFPLEYRGMPITYDAETNEISLGVRPAGIASRIKACQIYKDDYQACIDKVYSKKPEDIRYYHNAKIAKSGVPSLHLTLSYGDASCTASISCTAAEEKLEAFCQKLEVKAQMLRDTVFQKQEEARQILIKKGMYGNALVQDIISAHGNTHYSIAVSLRNYSRKSYSYSDIPNRDIQDFIREMENVNVPGEKPRTKRPQLFSGNKYLYEAAKEEGILHYGKDLNFPVYTDADWIHLLQDKNMELSGKDWRNALCIFKQPVLCCRGRNEIAEFFKGAPDGVKEYIKTMAKLESNPAIKATLKATAEAIKEKSLTQEERKNGNS